MKLSIPLKATILVTSILLFDQMLKIWVKTNMYIGQDFPVFGNWFLIHFVENPGMAFGLKFGGNVVNIFLNILRLIFITVIIYYVRVLIRNKAPLGYIACISLILAAAIGNTIDGAFYGLIFNTGTTFNAELGTYVSYSGVSQFSNDGYAPFLQGSVVDMLYFPIIQGTYPDWFPFMAGNSFVFFRWRFNIADIASTIGFFLIAIFYWKYFINSIKTKQLTSFGVSRIGLFGSYVRNEQQSKSDIDFLVDFEPEKETFDSKKITADDVAENSLDRKIIKNNRLK